ncbi:MAG: hypothetical protein ABIQ93_12850 [Saprospiraceae bacterium]
MPNHPDYERLALPLLAGDRTAVQTVFDQCFPTILALVQRGGGQYQDAEDVFMSTLEVFYLLARRPEFYLSSSLSTLLYGIGRIQWLKALGKKNNIPTGTMEAEMGSIPAEDLTDAIQQAERYQLYREKFAQLDPECQKLLLLSFQNLSSEAVAANMTYSSEGYARKRKHHCKAKLIRLVRTDRRFEELRIYKHDK